MRGPWRVLKYRDPVILVVFFFQKNNERREHEKKGALKNREPHFRGEDLLALRERVGMTPQKNIPYGFL